MSMLPMFPRDVAFPFPTLIDAASISVAMCSDPIPPEILLSSAARLLDGFPRLAHRVHVQRRESGNRARAGAGVNPLKIAGR